ncbi:MAG: HAMP domain-containing protein [Alphaproteobacteria bacterium]|nr:HAMP domain-containing protein [Alphaproteobacteria bacterium]
MIRNLSVRHKVTAIAVMTTTMVLALASVLFVALEINNYRRALVQELTAIAQISASNSTAAIVFDDQTAAHETLAALGARPNIEAAAIFTPDGSLFARQTDGAVDARGDHLSAYLAELSTDDERSFAFFWTKSSVDLYGPVELDGQVIGVIHIHSNLDQIVATIWTYVAAVMIIILLAIGLAWLLASLLQRQVTVPIFALLDTVSAVAQQRDYSLRAPKHNSDELGALVDGFNAMLAETEAHKIELNTARKEAESANHLKSDFLAQMSHELRTPLNAILGFSDFMLSEPHGPLGHENYREYMRDIHGGGQHLLGVINDILDMSKIEAGAVELNEGIVDAELLLDESAKMLRERAAKAGVSLRAEVEPGLPNLFADGQLIKRGLLNLLYNAIKFTPSGGQITVRADAAPDGAIALTVIDNGVGIAPQNIAHCLTPFGQAENVMRRSQDGTGLGLPMVKSLVELHGGVLELHSALGEGTKASLLFPAERTRVRPVGVGAVAKTPVMVIEEPALAAIA